MNRHITVDAWVFLDVLYCMYLLWCYEVCLKCNNRFSSLVYSFYAGNIVPFESNETLIMNCIKSKKIRNLKLFRNTEFCNKRHLDNRGKWISGLRHCEQIRRFLIQTPPVVLRGWGIQLHFKDPSDLWVKKWWNTVINIGWVSLYPW